MCLGGGGAPSAPPAPAPVAPPPPPAPAPPPPAPMAKQVKNQDQVNYASGANDLKKNRIGRAGLRIDLNNPGTSGGVNVPQ